MFYFWKLEMKGGWECKMHGSGGTPSKLLRNYRKNLKTR
jgi:hypothetical protein